LKPFRLFAFLLFPLILLGQQAHPILAIGSPAPEFSLLGVDGKAHALADYSSSPVLVVVFTCNHCPIAQMYEQRIQQLADDYRDRGVALVAIQPNDPKALRIDELDSSDVSDSLDEMKIRVAYKHLRYPYVYTKAASTTVIAPNWSKPMMPAMPSTRFSPTKTQPSRTPASSAAPRNGLKNRPTAWRPSANSIPSLSMFLSFPPPISNPSAPTPLAK